MGEEEKRREGEGKYAVGKETFEKRRGKYKETQDEVGGKTP